MSVQATAAEPDVHRAEHTRRPATTFRALGCTHVVAYGRHRPRLLDVGAAVAAAVLVDGHDFAVLWTKPATQSLPFGAS
jgi:hypothetical protein